MAACAKAFKITENESMTLSDVLKGLAAAQTKTENDEKPLSEILKDMLSALKQALALSTQNQSRLKTLKAKVIREDPDNLELLDGLDHKIEAEKEKINIYQEKIKFIESEHKRLFLNEIFKRSDGEVEEMKVASPNSSPRLQLKEDIEKLKRNVIDCPKCL
ncbi:uncharacterized protein SAPINGB_P001149 [Magnusiomyces paraingens]|uniref:Uncharacterized protein n=1 Tax=Magnusiomyces paraingens TaxID=2606893 RepID=A0A5E8B4A0_9ASCO|nr:uncharacterized protein SAPINGB_P001149 [Saprochaete ingens]VVT46308.1 unnamed protein product [Saprochaete ingens]